MVFSSQQIGAMNAQYQQQMAMQFQNASMIGAQVPLAEGIAGGTINRVGAVGGPMATLGLGLMGLDPVSIGLRAGMGASGMGMGFAGAGAVGLGAAGVAGAGFMAAGYAANQIFSGAQQQQTFNAGMNSTFRFANQYGGHGFGRQGLGEIGSMMRQMSTEQGPSGQMVGFEELGRLASNMGRMGMAQGVRDAKEFSDKFRDMIKTVKAIAETMGTSLEEAQKMMGAMRSSGVFGQNQAAQFAQRVRLGAAAGGMATSELTGMMNIGSQISRMVGGRGRAGAAGGLETITNIGVAQQMGLISEEDIYNTTGLTGAEGRRAMATRQMEQSAQFLKGSLGRRFLASVAGKGGTLDAGSVEEYLAGGVGTGRTTEMYHRNLSKVGRADFIRNEGRLRGAALEQFGGLAPMIAMKGWLDERGINVNEDNDRAMIFMQRQLGMGTDESEMMLRQVKELPNLMRQRRIGGQDDDFQRKMAERKSHSGLQGIKHKFEKARADVNATLNQIGAEFYENMSEGVERFINNMTDSYVKETRTDVAGAFRSVLSGGALGTSSAASTFGIGGGKAFRMAGTTGQGLFGAGKSDMDVFNKSDRASFAAAGYGLRGNDITGNLSTAQGIYGAFRSGGAGLAGLEGVQAAGAAARGAYNEAISSQGGISGKGLDRLRSFGAFLDARSKSGDASLGALASRFKSASSDIERAQIMAAFTSGAGRDESGNFQAPELRGVYGLSGMLTAKAGAETLGGLLRGPEAEYSVFGGNAEATGQRQRDAKVYTAAGGFLMSEGGRDIVGRMMSRDAKTRASALETVQRDIADLRDKSDRSVGDNGRLKGLQSVLFAQKLTQMSVDGANSSQIEAEAKRLAQEQGVSFDEVMASAKTVSSLASYNEDTARTAAGDRFGDEGRKNIAGMRRGGLVTGEGKNLRLDAAAADKLGGGAASRAFLEAMVGAQNAMAQMGPGVSPERTRQLMGDVNNAAQGMSAAMGNMSVAEMRRMAGNLVGVSGTEDARMELGRTAAIGEHVDAGGRRGKGGKLSAAADVLGVNLTPEQVQRMLKEGGVGGVAKGIAAELGVGDNEAFVKQLTGSLGDIQGGKTGAGANALKGLMDDESVQKARKLKQEEADKFDPNKNLDKIQGHTEKMAKGIADMAGTLSSMNTRMEKNAEDWIPFN
jgi:hypothetical protein